MLGTLLLGILAGAGAPYVEPHIKKVLDDALMAEAPLSPVELRLFSFALCLMAAGLLSWLIAGNQAFWLAVGAALGVFAPRIIARLSQRDD